ncbi:DUF4097 family beta strand repeat-containing protein [Paucisalibacillus sp. EB02]|uniref:DUF4097 family beta strand repeat-containing protein n=1 Tax=Paucisalibacillus sp. EB02 TaxID=1347087 RepID=UPI0005A5E0B2|nr:DUF4097 family beta strand repeat-containing protein [Paucisalibacillus sp. EB02]
MRIEKTVGSVVNRVIRNAKRSIVKEEVIQKERIDYTSLKEIHIITSSLNVEVISHDKPHIDIVLKTYEDGPEMKINLSNHVLEITVFKPSQQQTFFGLFPSTKMQLFVPTSVTETWDVRTGSGDVRFSKVIMNKLAINTGSGDIDLSDIEAGQISLRCASGDVKANNMKSDNFYVNSSSGDMVFRRLTVSNVRAEVNSGDILIADLLGEELEVKMATGDVNLKNIHIAKGTIVSRSGDVDANYVQAEMLMVNTTTGVLNINDFSGSLNGSVVSGDLKLGVKENCTINLDAKSGDIAVELGNEVGLNATVDITSNSEEITTNLPLQLKSDSIRLIGVTGDGENTIRISSESGDVKVYMQETANV